MMYEDPEFQTVCELTSLWPDASLKLQKMAYGEH